MAASSTVARSTALFFAAALAARAASDIPDSCRYIHVSGAGTSAVNGWYTASERLYERKFRWCLDTHDSCGSSGTRSVAWSVRNYWSIISHDRVYRMIPGHDDEMPVSDVWTPINDGRAPVPTVTCHRERSQLPENCPYVAVSGSEELFVDGIYESHTLYRKRRSWKRLDTSQGSVVIYYGTRGLWEVARGHLPTSVSDTTTPLFVEASHGGKDVPLPSGWVAHFGRGVSPTFTCQLHPRMPPTPPPARCPTPAPTHGGGDVIRLPVGVEHKGALPPGDSHVFSIDTTDFPPSHYIRFALDFHNRGAAELYVCCGGDVARCPTRDNWDRRSDPGERPPISLMMSLANPQCRTVRALVFGAGPTPWYTLTARVAAVQPPPDTTPIQFHEVYAGTASGAGEIAMFSVNLMRLRNVKVLVETLEAPDVAILGRFGQAPTLTDADLSSTTVGSRTRRTCIEGENPPVGDFFVGVVTLPSSDSDARFRIMAFANSRLSCAELDFSTLV